MVIEEGLPGRAEWGETRMKRKRLGRVMALLLGCVLALSPCGAGSRQLFGIVSYAETRTGSINATSLNVRSGPGTGNQAIAKLSQGAPVTVIGETTGSDGKLWYQIRFSGGSGETTGYVLGQYVKFPTVITSSADFEQYLVSQGFPESYKPGLRELHAKYPSWTFTALHTNLDWSTAVENECVIGRNLVARDNISSWKSTATGAYDWDTGTWPGFDGNSWVQASAEIISYYMDPRNFLNEKYIYQFMKQSYDSSIHSKEGLQSMVAGTFLSGTVSAGGSSSGRSSSGSSSSGSGPGSGPGVSSDNGSSSGPISPVASISDHLTERVTTVYGPGMNDSATSETRSSDFRRQFSAGGEQYRNGSSIKFRYRHSIYVCGYYYECRGTFGSESLYPGIHDSAGAGKSGDRPQYLRNCVRISGIL